VPNSFTPLQGAATAVNPNCAFVVYSGVMQDTKHLLNRIAFGAHAGDIERVQDIGSEKFLEQQLHPERIADESVEERLAHLPSIRLTTAELFQRYRPLQQTRALQMRPMLLDTPQEILLELQAHKLIRAVYSQRQLQEVMTDFWFNHFNVFWGKN